MAITASSTKEKKADSTTPVKGPMGHVKKIRSRLVPAQTRIVWTRGRERERVAVSMLREGVA